MRKHKFIVIISALILLLALSSAAEGEVLSGYVDADTKAITRTFDTTTGKLTVEGRGAIPDFDSKDSSTMYQLRELVKSI